jgi:hypothetical protein
VKRKRPNAARTSAKEEILLRLAVGLVDNEPLLALYENYKKEFEAATARYFGKNQLARKAVLNLLFTVASRARAYGPQSMNDSEWVTRIADTEARRLREALDTRGSMACVQRG